MSKFDFEDFVNGIDLGDGDFDSPVMLGLPLIDIKEQEKWLNSSEIVKGFSGRWILPTRIGTFDTILMVVDVNK